MKKIVGLVLLVITALCAAGQARSYVASDFDGCASDLVSRWAASEGKRAKWEATEKSKSDFVIATIANARTLNQDGQLKSATSITDAVQRLSKAGRKMYPEIRPIFACDNGALVEIRSDDQPACGQPLR